MRAVDSGGLTSVMTPMRSTSRLGLRVARRGVEFPEPGGEEPESAWPGGSRVGGNELMERKRPPRLSPLPTRDSISSARIAVLSFSSWIILRTTTSTGV